MCRCGNPSRPWYGYALDKTPRRNGAQHLLPRQIMDCLFCDIIGKKKEAHIIYEDNSVVAFLDVFPCATGHTLVVPRRHMETIIEMQDTEIGFFWKGVRTVTLLLLEKLSPHGFTIGINHGKVSGQAIEHMHVHIIPRYEGDGGGSLHSVVHIPPAESVADVYKNIINSHD